LTLKILLLVSIHAPVKGATLPYPQSRQIMFVSIHAPVKGATCSWGLLLTLHTGFNPRAREGRDIQRFLYKYNRVRFNPRAREGRDFAIAALPPPAFAFQSTRP